MPKSKNINPYQLSRTGDGLYQMSIYGQIGSNPFEESIEAKYFIEELNQASPKKLEIRMNTEGGSVVEGLAIYNAINSCGATVTTINEGIVASIGAYIFMAGDVRKAHENTLYMIHAPGSQAGGNAKKHREIASILDKFSQAEVSTFTKKTGMSEDDAKEILMSGDDYWYLADEAKEKGFVTDVISGDGSFSQFSNTLISSIPERFQQVFAPKSAPQITQSDTRSVHAEPTTTEEVKTMPQENVSSAAPVEQKIDVEKIKQDALDQFKARSKTINGLAQKFELEQSFADELIEGDLAMDKVNEKILQKLSEAQPAISNVSQVKFNNGREDAFKADVIQGLSARGNVKNVERNKFSQFGFQDIARACCEQSGINVAGMSSKGMILQAITHSTSDFANIFENVMHKTMLDQYNLASHTWRSFCAVGDLSDFRAHNRYRASSFGDLKGLQENGEFKNVTIGDAEKETISASSKGMIFNLSYEMIVNDDMGAFLSLARGLGRAAHRSVENDVYALLASNPNMSDGIAMFHADHGNLPTGAAISMAALDAGRVAMRKQKEVGENDYLDISPAIFLTGVANGGLARQTIASETDPSKTNSKIPNIVRGMAEVVDTPRISGNEWYLFANPSQNPAIEVGFLNGVSEPEIITEESFNSRGVKYRVAFDYGTAAVDSRAAIKNVGA